MNSGFELLAPARDLLCGRVAIDCGADAVYVGSPRFGAREAAGNSLDDIETLTRHAHKFWARVYVTLNTLLRDDELPAARALAWQLHEIGVDGLIVQDMGLVESGLPPLAWIASTQMHNHTPERVAFLERVGFRRAILARELDLDQIRAIRRAAPRIELEAFVHGALCVCYSGQCYLSYALGGRSGNRGQCAQPCRKPYTLLDASGKALERDRHLLSLGDLNLSGSLGELIEAGVTSFKVEGRLKDSTYVANVVAHYSARLDAALRETGGRRSSSGAGSPGFTPDPAKTFNRGFSSYFLYGRGASPGSPETPKMVGESVGPVVRVERAGFTVETELALHAGDGLCFFDRRGELRGTVVNAVRGRTVAPDKMDGIAPGVAIHRNHDHEFLGRVRASRPERRIAVRFVLAAAPGGLALSAVDEDGVCAEAVLPGEPVAAEKPETARATLRRQLEKLGDTEFACAGLEIAVAPLPFLPVAEVNALRRETVKRLRAARAALRPLFQAAASSSNAPYPEKELSYLGNVLNRQAEAFYRRHGVVRIEPAAEAGLDLAGRRVMLCRYCVKHQLQLCPREGYRGRLAEPLFLVDHAGPRLELRFDCGRCLMEIYLA